MDKSHYFKWKNSNTKTAYSVISFRWNSRQSKSVVIESRSLVVWGPEWEGIDPWTFDVWIFLNSLTWKRLKQPCIPNPSDLLTGRTQILICSRWLNSGRFYSSQHLQLMPSVIIVGTVQSVLAHLRDGHRTSLPSPQSTIFWIALFIIKSYHD